MGLLDNTYSKDAIAKHIQSLSASGLTGKALEDRIYADAKAKGVTTGQLENAAGWKAGTVENWTANNNKEALVGGYNQNVYDYKDRPAGSIGSGEIKDTLESLYAGSDNMLDAEMQMYQASINAGMTNEDIEKAMGYTPGHVSAWVNRNSVDQLTGTSDHMSTGDPDAMASGWQNSPYSAVSREINKKTDTVQGQLDDLLNKENPLMQRAYYKGQDYANSRGLLNSSVGSEAAQAAMMDAAMPIAQQDASSYLTQGMANQGYSNEFNLNDRRYLQTAEQAALDRDLSRELGGLDRGEARAESAANVTANTQGAYLSSIDKITSNAMDAINRIEVSVGIDQAAKDAMIENTILRRDADLSWTRSLYSNMPTWDFSWIDLETMPAAPGL